MNQIPRPRLNQRRNPDHHDECIPAADGVFAGVKLVLRGQANVDDAVKRNAAKFGLISGILCFVLGAFVFDRPWSALICFALAGGTASVLPVIWGTRLVRIGGIGCCIICFSAAAITFIQSQGIDALFQRKWDRRQARNAAYAELKKLPLVAKDFATPEGAILCLEDA